MLSLRPRKSNDEDELVSTLWDPESDRRCIVCNQPSGGMAICPDERCAAALANG